MTEGEAQTRSPFASPFVIGALVAAFLVGIGGTLAVQAGITAAAAVAHPKADPKEFFASALHKCSMSSVNQGVSVGDGGASLALDNRGDEDTSGMSFTSEKCILEALDIPDSVLDEMLATRALDGRQSDSWGHVDASWSYHPDSGLDVIMKYR